MRLGLCVALIVTAMAPGVAVADIRIDEVNYEAGILVVRGKTVEPDQVVTLDERFKERSNPQSDFVFRVPYRPESCEVELRAGEEVRKLPVSNCGGKPPAQ